MPLTLDEGAAGGWQNANFMAVASDLAYDSEAEAQPKFRELLGLDARLIFRNNIQAYILTNANHIIVAFRGTEAPTSIDGLKDWLLTDAMNLLIVPQGRLGTDLIAAGVSARFHQGFVGAIGEIWDPVFEAVTAELKASDRPLWITGHSLGGALALLAAWLFVRKFVSVHQVYTFGGPMIGNKDAVAALDRELKGKIFRYVEPRDPVPQLPTMSIVANEFDHCETLVGLGEFEPGSFWKNVASHAIGGVFTGAGVDATWQYIMDRVGAHSMTNYIEIVKKKLNG